MKKSIMWLIFSSLFVIIIIFLLIIEIFLNRSGAYLDSYALYCPENCPNSLWTCIDRDIYFASDKNGRTLGATKKDGKVVCYGISFNMRTKGFDVWELENIAYPHIEFRSGGFTGDSHYKEDSCILTYYGVNDRESYFGEQTGKTTLTFVRSNLTAPFSFDSEESLNELPFR